MGTQTTLHLLLIDDDPLCLQTLEDALRVFDDVIIEGRMQNGSEVVSFLKQHPVDVIFLDVQMEEIGGFELARYIRGHYPQIQIIFQTGHAGYAVDGYEFQPADFLVKPVNPLKLERALSHARERLGSAPKPVSAQIGIRTGSGLTILNVDDILYIEKSGRHIYILYKEGERILTTYSLQNLQTIFEEYDFIRCHQSFLVPLKRIRRIQSDELNRRSYTIHLEGVDTPVPLSRDRYDTIKDLLAQRGLMIY